jgi:hypothetical protein
MIFEIVIQEAIISLDQCDHRTFPYIQTFFSDAEYRHWFHGSYCRLRLVCRSFSAMLGIPPVEAFWDTSPLPFRISTRSLYIKFEGVHKTHFPRLFAEPSPYEHIVYLDVTCPFFTSSDQPDLFDFLYASEGQAFHNVQRLTLRLLNEPYKQYDFPFWTRLSHAFPVLVTLVITLLHADIYGRIFITTATKDEATLERLEILYLGGIVSNWSFTLPRLQHA